MVEAKKRGWAEELKKVKGLAKSLPLRPMLKRALVEGREKE